MHPAAPARPKNSARAFFGPILLYKIPEKNEAAMSLDADVKVFT